MIQTHSARLKLHDDDWKSLGVSFLSGDTVTCPEGLVEGQDFTIDRERGTVRRLRPFGRDLYTFQVRYDDRAEEQAAEEVAETSDREVARQAVANLQAYVLLESPTAAQTVAVVKLLCRVATILIRRALGIQTIN